MIASFFAFKVGKNNVAKNYSPRSAHTYFMKNNACGGWLAEQDKKDIFECPRCGNHVCSACAEHNNFLCPHCFSALSRIN